jgi:palmitoyl-[glycerolipid] 3-(E)-desaturase
MKTATAAAAATLALSAVAVQGFVLPVMPSPSSRHLLRRPLASVRLTQDVEVLQSVGLAPEMQGSSSTNLDLESSPLALESATLSLDPASGEKRVKRKGPPPPIVVAAGDLLESTWVHRLHVATHYLVTLVALQQVASSYVAKGGATPMDIAVLAAASAFSLVFSDFFSGVFHWSVDNYGSGKTPVLGAVIEAFQGHHDAPWTITYREFCNNVHKITKITIPAMMAVVALHPANPLLTLFATLFFNLQVLSQEFHKISHLTKPPAWAVMLQDMGLIISRKEHGQHHSNPFESNYCILTGTCNAWLDESGFFRVLERGVYEVTGVKPNCWKLGGEEFQAQVLLRSRGGADVAGVEEKKEEEKLE